MNSKHLAIGSGVIFSLVIVLVIALFVRKHFFASTTSTSTSTSTTLSPTNAEVIISKEKDLPPIEQPPPPPLPPVRPPQPGRVPGRERPPRLKETPPPIVLIPKVPPPPAKDPGGDWNEGYMTAYSSYVIPNSVEAIEFNGAAYEGLFAYGDRKYSREEVAAMNIVSFTIPGLDGAGPYKLKTIRVRDPENGKQVDAKVMDMCGNSDCNGCCDKNAANAPSAKFPKGVLVDLEYNTANRMYGKVHQRDLSDFPSKKIQWKCMDC